ncbi:hypothetical protein GCM10029992_38810 [Glycomyces albus]
MVERGGHQVGGLGELGVPDLSGEDQAPGQVAGDDQRRGFEGRDGDRLEFFEGLGEDLGAGVLVEAAPGGDHAVAVGEGDRLSPEQAPEASGGFGGPFPPSPSARASPTWRDRRSAARAAAPAERRRNCC